MSIGTIAAVTMSGLLSRQVVAERTIAFRFEKLTPTSARKKLAGY